MTAIARTASSVTLPDYGRERRRLARFLEGRARIGAEWTAMAGQIPVSDPASFGPVAVNTVSFTGSPVPFGGWKQSGLGREGARQGLTEFMETKYVCFGDLAA